MFRKEELFIQRIYLDEPFITISLEKCKEFIKVGVLPELVAKFYSREPISSKSSALGTTDNNELWCYCRGEESGEMFGCDTLIAIFTGFIQPACVSQEYQRVNVTALNAVNSEENNLRTIIPA